MPDQQVPAPTPTIPLAPDPTAVRVALWRALHALADARPHVLEDEVGLQLVAPDPGWQEGPDMDLDFTRRIRASMVARARVIEDLVVERESRGVRQYILLGAGLDSFAQRRPEIASRLRVFEIDRPGPQEWKRRRLVDLGFGVPDWLRLVPVDFEAGASWVERLVSAGFDASRPAVVASTGVSMYLTRDANEATLREIAGLAADSTLAMTFVRPMELVHIEDRPLIEAAQQGAAATGTPFVSYFAPTEIVALARAAGFKDALHVSAESVTQRYFTGRKDGLRPSSAEEMLLATT